MINHCLRVFCVEAVKTAFIIIIIIIIIITAAATMQFGQ
jgi:hypothetical protein